MSSDYKYICVTHDHGYVPLVANTSRSFPHLRLNTGVVTRLTWRVSLEEQVLLSFREHLSSPPVFIGVRVTRSLVLYVCFVDRCLSFCFTVFRLLTDFVCLYNYEFWLSLCKIVRSSVILLLPLFVLFLLAIVLSVLLWNTNSNCPFGILKLCLSKARV